MSVDPHESMRDEFPIRSKLDSKPKVCVLLAAYNGVKYIAEQVDSILNQELCEVEVWASDDQSTDGTFEWLSEKSRRDPRVLLLPRIERFGNAARNFYRLFRDVDFHSYDYVALADQDDIWLSDKLAWTIRRLRELNVSAISSNVIAIWPNGSTTLIEKSQRQRRLDFLFESAGPGCTYLITSEAAAGFRLFLLENRDEVDSVQFHDWMLYAWARSHCFLWHIDSRPMMYYRQHDQNEYGANSGAAAFLRRFKNVRSGWYRAQILKIARLISDGAQYTDECAAAVSLVERQTIKARVLLAGRVKHLRRKFKDRVLLLLALALGGI